MSNEETAKKLLQHIVEDCTQTENRGNVCGCVADQISGIMSLETIPETKELYFEKIEALVHELRLNMGYICNRRKIGSVGTIQR